MTPRGGFTLIEVMVTMLLTALLVVGLTGLWGMVGEQFSLLTWRQRAVFTLNGHAEKIAALYRRGLFGSSATTDNQSVDYPAGHQDGAAPHTIFTGSDVTLALVTTNGTTFLSNENNEGVVLHWDQGTGGDLSDDRNVVWLDKENKVTAVLSWTVDGNVTAANCYGGTPCQWATLYLDYPYRYIDEDNPMQSMLAVAETVSLRIVSGRRY